ncbi:MAG: PAS domain S-box protein [Desulfobulbaceae bacterium]|nr:PAS domain S-box protein [Desulfobulbaceae bacterium]
MKDISKEALLKSEAIFRAIFDQAAVGVALTATYTGELIEVNQKYCDIVGYSADKLKTLNFQKITHPDDLQPVLEKTKQLQEGKTHDFSMEKRYLRPDGSTTWVNLTVSPLWKVGEEPTFHIAVIEDITKRKETEKLFHLSNSRLIQARDHLKNVFDNSADAIGIVDKHGMLKDWNRAAEHLYGYSPEEVKGTPISSIYAEQKDFDTLIQELRKKSYLKKYEIDMKNKEGKILPFELSISLLKDKNNNNVGSVCVARDLTERKSIESALRKSEERYREHYIAAKETGERYQSLLKSTLDAIVTYDTQSSVTFVNNAFRDTFGWELSELSKGVPYVPASEQEITRANVMKVIQDGIPLKDFETTRLTKQGKLINVNISASLFNDHQGNPAGMVVILRDITKSKTMEAELKRLASTDPLTGADNRRGFLEKGAYELRRAKRYNHPFSFLMMDVDHFKAVNDTYGHQFGDQVLKQLVSKSYNVIRDTDILGRLGGEEFAVILPETNTDTALIVGKRLNQELAKIQIKSDQGGIRFTVSIGFAMFEKDVDTVETIMARADSALYKAKMAGRNRLV